MLRRRWLLGLLILQSISSVVLDSYQDLLKEHIVVTFFLTMLVRCQPCLTAATTHVYRPCSHTLAPDCRPAAKAGRPG